MKCTKCGKKKKIVFADSFRVSVRSGLCPNHTEIHKVKLCQDCLNLSARISFSNENSNFIRSLTRSLKCVPTE